MPNITHLVLDQDNCLIIDSYEAAGVTEFIPTLTPVDLISRGKSYQHYAINLAPMRKIIKASMAKGIQIVLLTNNSRPKQLMLDFFERIYELEQGVLKNIVYINADDYPELDRNKGAKLYNAVKTGLLGENVSPQQVLALDDDPANIDTLKEYNFHTVLVCGFPMRIEFLTSNMPVNNNYLSEVANICELNLSFNNLAPISNTAAVMDRRCLFPKVDFTCDAHLWNRIKNNKNTFLFVEKIISKMTLKSFDKDFLESVLLIVANDFKKEYTERWNNLVKDILTSLSKKQGWDNYKLVINNQEVWPLLNVEVLLYALQIIPKQEVLDCWIEKQAKYPQETDLADNLAICLDMENSMLYGNSEDCRTRLLFMAKFGVFDDPALHPLFNYTGRNLRFVKHMFIGREEKIIENCVACQALQVAAQHRNVDFILQILMFKYHYGIQNKLFFAECSAAINILLDKSRLDEKYKNSSIIKLKTYLKTFWRGSDETRLYRHLSNKLENLDDEPKPCRLRFW